MDSNNWRPNQGTEPTVDTGEWRNQLQPDRRQRIVNKIMGTLIKYLPGSGSEGLPELQKIAQRFEDKIYTAATSKDDYLRKIAIKMLTMEAKNPNTIANGNNMLSNEFGTSNKPPDPELMDSNNWRSNQGIEPTIDTSDWRAQLKPESRQRIVNSIMGTLEKLLPISGSEELLELWKIAQKFEDKVFTAAISESDYLRKISITMLTMETEYQNTIANNMPSNEAGPSNKPPSSQDLLRVLNILPTQVTSGWRAQLPLESRQRIVNEIMDNLKELIPDTGPERLLKIQKMAQRFEEDIFTVATSQSNYLKKISLKMLALYDGN